MPRKAIKLATVTRPPLDPTRAEQIMLDAFMVAADRFDARHGGSKEAARKQLLKEGVITRSGRLTKRFGG